MIFLGLLCIITKHHALQEHIIDMYTPCTRSIQLLPWVQILRLGVTTALSKGPSASPNTGSLVTTTSGAFTQTAKSTSYPVLVSSRKLWVRPWPKANVAKELQAGLVPLALLQRQRCFTCPCLSLVFALLCWVAVCPPSKGATKFPYGCRGKNNTVAGKRLWHSTSVSQKEVQRSDWRKC